MKLRLLLCLAVLPGCPATYVPLGDVTGEHPESGFGSTVVLSATGTRLVSGAPLYQSVNEDVRTGKPTNQAPIGEGAVSVYELDSNQVDWNMIWFLPGERGEGLGRHVSCSADGNRLALVRTYDNSTRLQVYHIETDDATGTTTSWQVGNGISVCDGATLSLSPQGNRVAIGCSDHVDILDEESTDWQPVATLSVTGDSRGMVLAFSDHRLAISTPYHFDSDTGRWGLVQVYEEIASEYWMPVGIALQGPTYNSHFGSSLDLSANDNVLMVGAPARHGLGMFLGSVHAYSFNAGDWQPMGSPVEGLFDQDRFGRSVSVSRDGNRFVATSVFTHVQGGSVRAFEFDGSMWNSILGPAADAVTGSLRSGTPSASMSGDGLRLAFGSVSYEYGTFVGRVHILEDDLSPPSSLVEPYAVDPAGLAAASASATSLSLASDEPTATTNPESMTTETRSMLSSCQCDPVSSECLDTPVEMGGTVDICLRSVVPDIKIVGVEHLAFKQGSLERVHISNGVKDSKTSTIVSHSLTRIHTGLDAAFFGQDSLEAQGTALITFEGSSEGRGARKVKDERVDLFAGAAGFELHLGLDGGRSAAAHESLLVSTALSLLVSVFVLMV